MMVVLLCQSCVSRRPVQVGAHDGSIIMSILRQSQGFVVSHYVNISVEVRATTSTTSDQGRRGGVRASMSIIVMDFGSSFKSS
jgi:hypothetical protein